MTLAPFDEEEKLNFRKFRDEDVIIVFNYICILAAFEAVVLALFLVYSLATGFDTKGSLVKFLYQFIVVIISGTVWSLGKRFRQYYTQMIGATFVLI